MDILIVGEVYETTFNNIYFFDYFLYMGIMSYVTNCRRDGNSHQFRQ